MSQARATPENEPLVFYAAKVMHRRRVAPLYRFVYRVFYLLWDIDRVDQAVRGLRFISHNRFNLLSFHDADHGARKPGPGELRAWAEQVLASGGLDLAGGRIRLLALPRVLGYAFNPITLWYCEHRDGRLRAVIAEVHNTFGEQHSYLLNLAPQRLPDSPALSGAASNSSNAAYPAIGESEADASPAYPEVEKDKCFHVSPFLGVEGRYRFALSAPGTRLRVAIHESLAGAPVLDATLACNQQPAGDATVLRWLFGMPWMTAKVVIAIHWEALKIWLRGARLHRKPPPPQISVS
jgi:DUF1365 family protein